MEPVRIDVAHTLPRVRRHARRRRPRPACRALLDDVQAPGAALRRLEPARLAAPRRSASRGASTAEADPRARRRALQAAADRRRASTTRSSAPTPIARRRSSPSAAASSATWRASPPPPTCAASRWCTCRRRCWRRWTARSAARWASTTPLGKNLIGAFYQPHAVVIDPSVLGTLPRREFRAGLYEVIKYGMTSSPSLFERVARERKAIFARDARRRSRRSSRESCRIKADVVAADETESGLRRILNFGHTAGHALEAVTQVPALPSRRSGRLRHAGRGRARRRRAARSPKRDRQGARRRHRQPRPAAADRRRLDRRRCSRRCSTTRRWSPAGCTSCCRRRSAPRRSWTM